ncbi:bifunctional phosphoribosylaminoimidazolecarboxamide formyltransferase/IMP cyclohydrolase [Candidatus Micrarchaeota archaeon]|nr:bifunctional phosphoribosylaminoimidazolecarboxamide formyltransferase/IMP cyclohydrolase [Candidatus Micrarchaeota archaeon]
MTKIRRALISVSDKSGIVEFAKGLHTLKIEIVSTGGTAKLLKENGIPVIEVSDYAGFPEMLDGRVKTLHPRIHAALLAVRDDPEHMEQLKKHDIPLIDLVVVNLYPFENTIKKRASLEEAIENIDIGGPAMLRSAAKNYKYIAVIADPDKYNEVLEELKGNDCKLSDETKAKLALDVFKLTSYYDSVITNYLSEVYHKDPFPEFLNLTYKKIKNLRYGENPHQRGALYKEPVIREPSIIDAVQLHGKELSFNNILDGDGALELLKEFEETTAVIVKHTTPCGVASAAKLIDAYNNALATDPEAAFGGIVALNREVTKEVAEEISKLFLEVVIAPDYNKEALEILQQKKNLRVLSLRQIVLHKIPGREIRGVGGGLLVQDRDIELYGKDIEVVTERKPTDNERDSMIFAWKVCKHVKSNGIVVASGNRTIGIGAGQMKRIDSANIAMSRVKEKYKELALASEAFFPFRDSIDSAAKGGITAVIQPGGSIRDDEVIQAANEENIAMIFTKMRHLRH